MIEYSYTVIDLLHNYQWLFIG